jgi:hypothetical protein
MGPSEYRQDLGQYSYSPYSQFKQDLRPQFDSLGGSRPTNPQFVRFQQVTTVSEDPPEDQSSLDELRQRLTPLLAGRVTDSCHRTAEAVCLQLGVQLGAPIRSEPRDEHAQQFVKTLKENALDGKPHLYLLRAFDAKENYNGHSWVVLQKGEECMTFQSNATVYHLRDWVSGNISDQTTRIAREKFGGLVNPVSIDVYGAALQSGLVERGDISEVTGCQGLKTVVFGFQEHRIGTTPSHQDIWSQTGRKRFDSWVLGRES